MSNITKIIGKLCKFFLKKHVKKFAQFKKIYYFCTCFRALLVYVGRLLRLTLELFYTLIYGNIHYQT